MADEKLETASTHPMLSNLTPERARKGKIVSAQEAVRVIRDGDTVATGGFVGIGFAEEIALQLEQSFLETGRPRDLAAAQTSHTGWPMGPCMIARLDRVVVHLAVARAALHG